MQIVSFVQGDQNGRLVTLQMSGIPKGTKSSQTTVRINGDIQGTPSVNPSPQTIMFQATREAKAGPIKVEIETDDGTLEAESSSDYVPWDKPDDPAKLKPMVTSMTPKRQKPGGPVNLGGRNLKKVTSVRLGSYNQDSTSRFTTHKDNRLTFPVPSNALGGDKQIWIKDDVSNSFLKTPFILTVEEW